MTVKAPKPPRPPSITSPRIRSLAGKGLSAPSTLTTDEVRELCGSVMEHIEPRRE
jgi:hypothetical protein